MRFDAQTRRMRVDALQAGVSIDDVRQQTGFELAVAPEPANVPPPTSEELHILRMLDPERIYLG